MPSHGRPWSYRLTKSSYSRRCWPPLSRFCSRFMVILLSSGPVSCTLRDGVPATGVLGHSQGGPGRHRLIGLQRGEVGVVVDEALAMDRVAVEERRDSFQRVALLGD